MKKIDFVPLVFLICHISLFGSWESEFEKMEFAQKCARERRHGFEGCANKDKCGFEGFYLAKYSPEGLCTECEFESYPERFIACPFCRRPTQKYHESVLSSACLMCASTIRKLIVKKLNISNERKNKSALQRGARRCMSDSSRSIARKFIAAFLTYNKRDSVFSNYGPHIYRGVILLENGNKLHIWVEDIDIAEEDKRETNWEDAPQYVASICEKYNIFGPETGEVILNNMPPHVSATYEEIMTP